MAKTVRADRYHYHATGAFTFLLCVPLAVNAIFSAVLQKTSVHMLQFRIFHCVVLSLFVLVEFVHFFFCNSFDWEVTQAIGSGRMGDGYQILDSQDLQFTMADPL